MRRIVSFAVLAGLVVAASSALAQDVPIAYVRCARTTATYDATADVTVGGATRSATRTLRGLDIYDVLPDVTHFFTGFSAPCDLVLRDPDGTERVLYDCSSTSTDAASCAAMDPAVSFDGRTIAFSVFRGPLEQVSEAVHPQVIDPAAENTDTTRFSFPNRVIDATEAQLHLVDLATGEVTPLPHSDGVYDAGPAWLSDGRLAFTSSRDDSRVTLVWGTNNPGMGARIYTMDVDGRNVDLASHHGLSMDEHPFQLADGRVAYSSWQIFGGLPFRHTNGSPGGFTTIANLFHIYTQHPDGAVPFAFFGQHAGDHQPITTVGTDHKAAHFLTQTTDGRVWFADYYRGNNDGLGTVIGVMPEPDGQEGIAPAPGTPPGDIFAPRDAIRLASWASSSDQFAGPMPAPAYTSPSYSDPVVFVGKLGHPAALPDNRLMVTWGKGACGTVTGNEIFAALGMVAPPLTSGSGAGTATNVFTSLGLDTPACDAGIYMVTRVPSEHPSDLQLVVDAPAWHEIMPRAVVPYAQIHGVDAPALLPRADLAASRPELDVGTPFGLLGAASILDRETHPVDGIHFMGEHQFQNQGTDTIDYADADLCGVRILGVQPNRGPDTYTEIANVAGERVVILGEIPVRNLDAGGAPRMDPSGNPDTSFLVRFPANVPYLMQGIDCEGRTLNTDQTWQSLRPGETKTCGGCHVHSRPSRVDFDQTFAATPSYPVPVLGEGEVPLLAGETGGVADVRTVPGYALQIDFTRDIAPIFRSALQLVPRRRDADGRPRARPAGHRRGLDVVVPRRGSEPELRPRRAPDRHRGGRRRDDLPPAAAHALRARVRVGREPALLEGSGRAHRRPDGRDVRRVEPRGGSRHRLRPGAPDRHHAGRARRALAVDRHRRAGRPDGAPRHAAADAHARSARRRRFGHRAPRRDRGRPERHRYELSRRVRARRVRHVWSKPRARRRASRHRRGIPLTSPLSNPDVEVRATVRDLEGNETELVRTVAWLLGSPPPPPPGFDGGPGGADAGTGPGDGGDSGCGCRIARASAPVRGVPFVLALACLVAWRVRRR